MNNGVVVGFAATQQSTKKSSVSHTVAAYTAGYKALTNMTQSPLTNNHSSSSAELAGDSASPTLEPSAPKKQTPLASTF